jgi:hypothetical protein
MASRDYRLLIDADVIDFLRTRPRRTQESMLARLRQIAGFPANFYDFTERDRVGRDLGVHMFGNYAIRFWEDPADGHLKVLEISSVLPPSSGKP